MRKLEIITTVRGTVFDTYVKPATEERKNDKTGEIYQAQPSKPYIQFIGERVLDKDSGENKKQLIDVKLLPNIKASDYADKDIELQVNVFNMGKETYYNQVENTEVKVIK